MTQDIKRSILVVEDMADLSDSYKVFLERAGFLVDVVDRKKTAINALRSKNYDVALVDLQLKDDISHKGGLDVLDAINDLQNETVAIVVSATHEIRESIAAYRRGIADFILKGDIKSKDLIDSIEKALQKRDRPQLSGFPSLSADLAKPEVTSILEASSHDPPYAKSAHQRGSTHSASEGSSWLPNDNSAARERFERLASVWERESAHISSPTEMALLPSYQEIIGMGRPAVPLILGRLSQGANHWFWALRSITGLNPVSEENLGRIDKMTDDWLRWGKQNGIIQ